MKVSLSKTFTFDAAHALTTFPEGHKCRQMHGHSFTVDVVVEGEVPEETGYLIDYNELKKAIEPVREQLDHHVLNEIAGLQNPTAERLSKWIWDRIKPAVPLLSCICVHETSSNSCEYRGQ